MNYLAHVFLAGPDPQAIAGALLGDFVKGAQTECYPPAVRDAIRLHRHIDRYTDHHAVVRASRGVVSASRRRFAGIMVDVFFDHFLARQWSRYSTEALPRFTARVYAALEQHRSTAPERLQRMLPRMRAEDWLAGYGQSAAIDLAIDGIARRLKRPSNLWGGGEELRRNYGAFEAHFLEFFPQLMHYVAAARASLPQHKPAPASQTRTRAP